ncbi:MAG: flavodoxin [Methanospirillum sp.]|nr:flavodoxin [Methanospirillum sp.]
MILMRAVIVYESLHHGNTKRVAEAMADAIGADLVHLRDRRKADLRGYSLVGLGSGIYRLRHHPDIIAYAARMKVEPGARAFVFSTAGVAFLSGFSHRSLRRTLEERGLPVAGELCLCGHDTYAIFGLIGGINRGRPDERDLDRARVFARYLAGT